jgi:hypothetical protein
MKASWFAPLFSVSLILGSTVSSTPAFAGGWFTNRDDCAPNTRHARCEYEAEHAQARSLQDLDCASLTAYAESFRMTTNARILAAYNAPQDRASAGTTPLRTPPIARPR